jgi:hypothetical protein
VAPMTDQPEPFPGAFWTAVVDGSLSEAENGIGPLVGLAVEALASPEIVDRLSAALERNERAETVGPMLHPSAWTGNRFERAALTREVLLAARALARAELARRAGWGGSRG